MKEEIERERKGKVFVEVEPEEEKDNRALSVSDIPELSSHKISSENYRINFETVCKLI